MDFFYFKGSRCKSQQDFKCYGLCMCTKQESALSIESWQPWQKKSLCSYWADKELQLESLSDFLRLQKFVCVKTMYCKVCVSSFTSINPCWTWIADMGPMPSPTFTHTQRSHFGRRSVQQLFCQDSRTTIFETYNSNHFEKASFLGVLSSKHLERLGMWLSDEEQWRTKHTKVSSRGYAWVTEDGHTLLFLCCYTFIDTAGDTGSTVTVIKPGKGEVAAHWTMLLLHWLPQLLQRM